MSHFCNVKWGANIANKLQDNVFSQTFDLKTACCVAQKLALNYN